MMESQEHSATQSLEHYINGQTSGRIMRHVGIFAPRVPFFADAKRVWRSILSTVPSATMPSSSDVSMHIEEYNARNVHLRSLQKYLQESCSDILIGAFLHGSLATGEEISYSDCDALAILKREVFRSDASLRRAAWKLFRAMKFINRYDPLQHHGWFVLRESELRNYPVHYLPIEVLRNAKSLLSNIDIAISINPFVDKNKILVNFKKAANSVKRKINLKKIQFNLFLLKGLLSQFMLLPTLYVQVRDSKGIFKKTSFQLARTDFNPSEWAIMDEVSAIRLNWHYKINFLQRFILTRSGILRYFFAKNMPIKIPKDIKKKLTSDFFKRMETLVLAMETRLKQYDPDRLS